MKIFYKIFFILILGGIVFLNTTCSDTRYLVWVTWEGNIYDSIGGKPTSDYWITLEACGFGSGKNQCGTLKIGSAKTDGLGHFKIHNEAARSDRYFAWWGNSSLQNVKKSDLNNYKTLYIYNH